MTSCARRPAHRSAFARRHQVITQRLHHENIPLGGERTGGKILIQMGETAPSVEVRPLAAYETVAMGRARPRIRPIAGIFKRALSL